MIQELLMWIAYLWSMFTHNVVTLVGELGQEVGPRYVQVIVVFSMIVAVLTILVISISREDSPE